MKKRTVRMLALAICLVMVLSMVPAKAKAVELESNKMPLLNSITVDAWGDYYFTTFADLQALATEATYNPGAYYCAYYEGYNDLYISSNLTIPDNMTVLVYENDMEVPYGVTMAINGYVYVEDEVTISGTVNIGSSGELGYTNILYIYGALNLEGCLSGRDCDALIYGEDRVNVGPNAYFYLNEWNATAQDILEMCAWGNVSVPNYYVTMEVNEPVTVSAAVTIPENTTITANNNLTFQGTVQLDGGLRVYAPVHFGGSVTNLGSIDIYCDEGGYVNFAQPTAYKDIGSYTDGVIWVNSYSSSFPAGALIGMGIESFENVGYHSEFDDMVPYWSLQNYRGAHVHVPTVLPEVPADCLTNGMSSWVICEDCGETLIPAEELAPLGHSYTDPWDTSCNVCGAIRKVDPAHLTYSMYRMYNPNTGEHFYTGSMEERQNLEAAGWKYEGVGFTFPYSSGDPVYRLYDKYNTMEHLYTMDPAEKDALLARGWVYEGIAFNSCPKKDVPQYRLWNPNATIGAYHFTASETERDTLLAAGWKYQGIGFYTCWQ